MDKENYLKVKITCLKITIGRKQTQEDLWKIAELCNTFAKQIIYIYIHLHLNI